MEIPPRGLPELAFVLAIGILATAVKLADDVPRTWSRLLWLFFVGLGLATGGWLMAKAMGLDGWPALAVAWVAGAIGQEAFLPLARKWLDRIKRVMDDGKQ